MRFAFDTRLFRKKYHIFFTENSLIINLLNQEVVEARQNRNDIYLFLLFVALQVYGVSTQSQFNFCNSVNLCLPIIWKFFQHITSKYRNYDWLNKPFDESNLYIRLCFLFFLWQEKILSICNSPGISTKINGRNSISERSCFELP